MTEPSFRIATDEEMDAIMAEMKANVERHKEESRAAGKRFLNEETDKDVIDGWWEEVKGFRSIDEAAAFAHRIMNNYHHDYGTICHAVAAVGVAMSNAVGFPAGVTGFQAGAIGWMLHSKWQQWGDEPRSIVDYSNLLYPQYDDKFATINQYTHEWLMKRAETLIAEKNEHAHPDVTKRWKQIASGWLPPFVTVSNS